MRYVALAAGYDGTLARGGVCDERCVEMLRALAATGRKLILVTGRQLRELLEIFPEARLFDIVIAENGAVMHRPSTRQSAILAQAPPEILLQELARRGVRPISVGSSSITTLMSNLQLVREVLQKTSLDVQLVHNDGVLSILPAGVDKASGVLTALKELGVSRHNLVAIGDGENDVALFALAAHAVAVCNADATLQHAADRITHEPACEGFLELARDLIATDLASSAPRTTLVLADDSAGRITIAPCRDSLLVYGPRASGKTALCENLVDQLLMQDYQCCLLSADLTPTPVVRSPIAVFGEPLDAPRLTDVLAALENPAVSVSINVAALSRETRPVFAEALLLQLQALHDRLGRPHCILIQQAESFVSREFARVAARLDEVTMIYTASDPDALPLEILSNVRYAVATGGMPQPPANWNTRLGESVQATTAGGASCRISAVRAESPAATASLAASDVAALSG